MSNQIMVIAPYWLEDVGTWVFDDPAAELCREPFVSGVPEMIDVLVKNVPDARAGFRLLPFQAIRNGSCGNKKKWAAIGTPATTRRWKAGSAPRCFDISIRRRQNCT